MEGNLLKISMIGVSGSGKTMLIGGVKEAFVSSCMVGNNGAVISATGSLDDPSFRGMDADGAYNGLTVAQQLEKFNRMKLMAVQGKDGRIGRGAAGTVEMSHIHLDFDVTSPAGVQLSQTIKLTDYRGGLLSISGDNITDIDTEECKAFMDNLCDSEIILVLLDGIKLAQYRNNASMRKEKTGADRINVLMNAVMKYPRNGVTLMLVVTKVDSDKIPQDLKNNNYKGLCDLACDTVECVYKKSRIMTQTHDWTFAVTPITAIGENNSVTQYVSELDEYICAIKNSADLQQHNIDAVMLYGIRNALSQRNKSVNRKIESCEKSISEEYAKMNIFNGSARRAFINEHNREKEGYARLRNKYTSMLSAINEGFPEYFSAVRRFGVV